MPPTTTAFEQPDHPSGSSVRTAAAPAAGGLRSGRPAERLGYAIGGALVAAGVFHLGVFLVAGGPWDGPVSWRKPFTFGVSFGLTLIAVTWVTSFLRIGARTRGVLLVLFAGDCVLEVTGITVQAWRHTPSHFNTSTPADTAVAMSLAAGGALLIVVLTRFAVAAFRHAPDGPGSMALALRAGFGMLLAGLASGAAMIARGVADSHGGGLAAAYHSTGPLKPVHAVTLHAVLVLPALAWLLARAGCGERTAHRVVLLAVWLYAAAAAGALGWGLSGA